MILISTRLDVPGSQRKVRKWVVTYLYIGAITYLPTFYTLCGHPSNCSRALCRFNGRLGLQGNRILIKRLKKSRTYSPKGRVLWRFTMVQNVSSPSRKIFHIGMASANSPDPCEIISASVVELAVAVRRPETVGPFKTQERAEIHTHTHSGKTCSA